ncbi:MAG: phosphopantetheine-binding protein [Bryobacteraceae bacterium]
MIQCVALTQRIPPESIQLESTFEELKIDSLDGINILFALENEFSVNIPDEAARDLRSIGDLARGLHTLIETGVATPQAPRPAPPPAAGPSGSAA